MICAESARMRLVASSHNAHGNRHILKSPSPISSSTLDKQVFGWTKVAGFIAARQGIQAAAAAPLPRHTPAARPVTCFASAGSTTSTQQAGAARPAYSGASASLHVRDLGFHPPGTEQPLLQGVSMDLPAHSMGLLIGRSGSGKTTLLQVLAGLCDQTSGTIHIHRDSSLRPPQHPTTPAATTTPPGGPGLGVAAGRKQQGLRFAARLAAEGKALPAAGTLAAVVAANQAAAPAGGVDLTDRGGGSGPGGTASPADLKQPSTSSQPGGPLPAAGPLLLTPSPLQERMARVGLVFQFPERHFLGQDVLSELTFTWPRDIGFMWEQERQRQRITRVMHAVGLSDINLSLPPWALSGGQQRRLALALQLVRQPDVLLLDEPLAGLDWRARREVVELLGRLKQECSLLVVSHDLRELSPIVDCAWSMQLGGRLEALPSWPPSGGLASVAASP
ncbi:P-loop containing nucleoside triphosphate hydrolase protein [Haematococcus lacustris]